MDTYLAMPTSARASALSDLQAAGRSMQVLGERGRLLRSGHARRAAAAAGTATAAAFRGVQPGQDEPTQSKRTAAEFEGMNEVLAKRRASLSAAELDQAQDFRSATAVAYSATRAPTRNISAPLRLPGGRGGPRHPTTPDVPTWQGGPSGHAHDDPTRAALANQASATALPLGPAVAVMATALAATQYTTASMSAPHTARNIDSPFRSAQALQQTRDREVMKAQSNDLATRLGLPIDASTQPADAPISSGSSAPNSPRRQLPP